MGGVLLQIFLIINVFAMGALAVIGFQHAYAHFRPQKKEADEEPHPISDELRVKLLAAAQSNFEHVLEKSAKKLEKDLVVTTGELNKTLEKIGAELVDREMQLYKENLRTLLDESAHESEDAKTNLAKHQAKLEKKLAERQATFEARLVELQTSLESTLTTRQHELDELLEKRRKELESQLETELRAQKDITAKQIDTKLADAIASFLSETLQHEVDLGAQETFLIAQLEAHKDELKKGLEG